MMTMSDARNTSPERNVALSVRRGFRCRCPACGEGRLFGRYLKVAEDCTHCGQAFHYQRADDFPPYIVMFIVCHVVGYGIYVSETHYEHVPLLFHALVWPSLAVGLSLALLQPVKGAVIGLQYGLGMHGFGGSSGRGGQESQSDGRARRETEDGVPDRRSGTALAERQAS